MIKRIVKEKGSALYQLMLIVLSFYVLGALLAETFLIEDSEIKRVLQYIDLAICLVFLIDFIVNLYKADSISKYMKWGWIDLISSIPMLDPLRWGRLARVVRIIRFLKGIRSIRIIYNNLLKDKVESLTILVFLFVFVSFTLSACLVLEFEKGTGSSINTAELAIWWAFLNIMNAKASVNDFVSAEAAIAAIYLNKVGLVLFAYFNAILISWLMDKRSQNKKAIQATL